jgi:transcriptional regulator with XRE-family HTH domain
MGSSFPLIFSDTVDSVNEAQPGLPEREVSVNQLVAYNMSYFRRAAGLTQEQLGERLGGWSSASVSAAERSWDGKRVRKFDADEVVSIALALGVPVIALLLPPADADTAVRYLLATEVTQPVLTSLLPYIAPTYGDDTAQLSAFWQRLMALGASRYIDPAAEQSDLLLGRARTEADGVLVKARRQSEQITGEARARAESLERDAQERHRQAMGSLVQSREALERRVNDLRQFEREYRSRLLAYLEGQVRDLRAGSSATGTEDPP